MRRAISSYVWRGDLISSEYKAKDAEELASKGRSYEEFAFSYSKEWLLDHQCCWSWVGSPPGLKVNVESGLASDD